jgi:hypothetical protein
MVIQAAAQFQCEHVYIGLSRETRHAFVCHRCGHRAQALLLGARVASGAVIAFPQRAEAAAASGIDGSYSWGWPDAC